ncbi:hypothetical protein DPQ33_08615 [Oceanidesulfovibrio indonesiensis]|uniref:Uncharacterized protein n=1 Tax=Oceanidesulfovibrio indonesiensis TaxID=54767 RepID=A0A7M3MF99_9BACT|nr:hypothetical protein [Oceanidesulfovibrio indonesiensis]TVM17691.1 hypothetical protein DPQ33_08615 [Oceanidesulfovibrio indonesiensis]
MLLIAAFLAFALGQAPALAHEGEADSPCLRVARERVTVHAGARAQVLDWHAAASCKGSRAVLAGCDTAPDELREEICRREVLAGAYTSACVYFRDVLCPDAYEPCKEWVLEQYERCKAKDMEWFRPARSAAERQAE